MIRRSLPLAIAAACLITPAAGAHAASGVNPCSLVSAKQTASFGIRGTCKLTTHTAPGFSASLGTWNLTSRTAHLSVAVNTYSSKSGPYWQIAMTTLNKLPGRAAKVSGIGTLAYESGGDGSTISAINFVVGNRVVSINLRTATAPKSLAAFNAVAKSIAARLK